MLFYSVPRSLADDLSCHSCPNRYFLIRSEEFRNIGRNSMYRGTMKWARFSRKYSWNWTGVKLPAARVFFKTAQILMSSPVDLLAGTPKTALSKMKGWAFATFSTI